jgi:hypothetical protein
MATLKEPQKRRAEWDKEGKYKYIIRKIGDLHRELEEVKVTLRYITKGLEPSFQFDKGYVEDIACQDEFDRAILDELRGAGIDGLLPRDLAKSLGSRRVSPWQVTQRLRRINKRLDRLLGQKAAEKRGMQWALTSFMSDAWGSTNEEVMYPENT